MLLKFLESAGLYLFYFILFFYSINTFLTYKIENIYKAFNSASVFWMVEGTLLLWSVASLVG